MDASDIVTYGAIAGSVAYLAYQYWSQEGPAEVPAYEDDETRVIVVTDVVVYPVKSCAGISVKSAKTNHKGFVNDREWMVVDNEKHRFVSARIYPKMPLIKPVVNNDGSLTLNAPGMPEITVPVSDDDQRECSVWDDVCMGADQGDAAAAWFSKYLGADLRLFHFPLKNTRPCPPKYDEKGDTETSWADGFPFLLAAEESLTQASKWASSKLGMRRFRPNIIVKGVKAPFDDELWGRFEINGVVFKNVKQCTRCKMTTVDPEKGTMDTENKIPLSTLEREHSRKKQALFGSNLIHENHGEVRVGDTIKIITRRPRPPPLY
eukprot:GFYU01014780.1.p2 GENE.GFYU01014780.1~~GFYU01014780.1.p2  ORF type:complete len:320 (-),score=65.89 GFYU01014780.1:35-994(-)